MDRNEEYEIIQILDRVIQKHASYIQERFNAHREIEDRMHISCARAEAMEELEGWLVEQLQHAHKENLK